MDRLKIFVLSVVVIISIGVLAYLLIIAQQFDKYTVSQITDGKTFILYSSESGMFKDSQGVDKVIEKGEAFLKSSSFKVYVAQNKGTGDLIKKVQKKKSKYGINIILDINSTPLLINKNTILLNVIKGHEASMKTAESIKDALKTKGIKVNIMQRDMNKIYGDNDIYMGVSFSSSCSSNDAYTLLLEVFGIWGQYLTM